jgi:cation transport ATPase
MRALPVVRVRRQEDKRDSPAQEQGVPQDDWSTQLKKIEREFEGLPPEPSPAYKKLQSEEQRRAQQRAQQRRAMIGGGARLVLVGALGVALAFWPYENSCGSGLLGYLAVEAVIVIGGLWVAISTWRAQLPKMHILSLLIALAGLVLLAIEILPRVGYAAVDPKNPPHFSCPETQNAPPTTAAVEQRVQFATSSLEARWKSRTAELSRQFGPQRAALTRLERPELLSQRAP